MKKIALAVSLLFSIAFSQMWDSDTMLKRVYDSNKDGIVDRAWSVVGPVGTASNSLYAVWSLSNSNSLRSAWAMVASNASNAMLLGGFGPAYYTNLSNTIGLLLTNRIADLSDFIMLFTASATNGQYIMITNLDRVISNALIAYIDGATNVVVAKVNGVSNFTVGATNVLSVKIDGVSNYSGILNSSTATYATNVSNSLKQYIDNLVSSYQQFYFLASVPSDIAGNYVMRHTSTTNSSVAITNAGVTNNQYLVSFLTLSNEPGITEIQAGTYDVRIWASKGAVGSVRIKAELYVLQQNGTIIYEIQDSPYGLELTTGVNEYNLQIIVPTNSSIQITNRLAVRIKANVISGSPTIVLYTEGGTPSAFSGGLVAVSETDPFSLYLDGSRAMENNLNMGGFNITNVYQLQGGTPINPSFLELNVSSARLYGTSYTAIGTNIGNVYIGNDTGTVDLNGSAIKCNRVPFNSNDIARLWEIWDATNDFISGDVGALLTNGSRAMASNLDMGLNGIVNCESLNYSTSLNLGQYAGAGGIILGAGDVSISGGSSTRIGTNGGAVYIGHGGDTTYFSPVQLQITPGAGGAVLTTSGGFTVNTNIDLNGYNIVDVGQLDVNTINAYGGTKISFIDDLDFGGYLLTNAPVPAFSNAVATKWYVDMATNGISGGGITAQTATNIAYDVASNVSGAKTKIAVMFSMPNTVTVDKWLYYGRGAGTTLDENRTSGGNGNGVRYEGNAHPYCVPFDCKVVSATVAVRGLGYDGAEQTNKLFSLETEIQKMNWDTATKIADLDFMNIRSSNTYIQPSYDIEFYSSACDNPTDYRTNFTGLSIDLQMGDLLGIKFDSGSGASQKITTIRQLYITLILEEN